MPSAVSPCQSQVIPKGRFEPRLGEWLGGDGCEVLSPRVETRSVNNEGVERVGPRRPAYLHVRAHRWAHLNASDRADERTEGRPKQQLQVLLAWRFKKDVIFNKKHFFLVFLTHFKYDWPQLHLRAPQSYPKSRPPHRPISSRRRLLAANLPVVVWWARRRRRWCRRRRLRGLW